ncbi:molecular chaperone DnaK [Vulgatibacter sp.]|uniref:molecular chaperone DnaK n=1 Tax=Vulgatibacter sp. TaxID=1971226 RepID=UPI0035672BC4
MASEPTIGIDLGTTNSVVATVADGTPVVIPSRSGHHLTPSVVAVARNGKRLVGSIAKRQAITNPEQTVAAAKRLIGRKYSSQEVQQASDTLPYPIGCGTHDDVRIALGGRDLTVPEISAMVLQELKLDAEAHFGQPVRQAVITVPAYFNDGQRQATKDAGRIAGLEVLRIINEPTAAALAYGFGKEISGRIVVYDLGGGTFDISVLELRRGVFEVLATAGDSFLGGEDFDNRIIEWLVFHFAREHSVDLRRDKMALQRLKDASEKAKCELSTLRETRIELPFLYTPPTGGAALHLQRTLTREKFEELASDLVERTIHLTEKVLEEARLSPLDIAEVVLVGGQTRMPRVQEAVRRLFGREPCKGVHADEVVALGAAIQGHALTTEESEVLLLDVTPQSLGIMVAGGYTQTIIARNTTVPTRASHIFTTVKDNQTSAKILVLQGEEEKAAENELLGEFMLTGLRPAPRGEVEIEVQFDISADGIVSVSAQDRDTGLQQSIQVTATSGLTEEEMQLIIEEQKDYLVEQKQSEESERRRAEVRNLLREVESVFPSVREIMQGSEFGNDAISKAERTLSRARDAVAGRDLEAMMASSEQLERTLALCKGLLQRVGAPRS